jgi:hypothetical protein
VDLKQLLEAMNAAKAAFEASPKDKALEAAFNEAKLAYETAKAAAEEDEEPDPQDPSNPPGEDQDESKWDDKTKALIKKLRGENAKHRTKAKELGSQVKTEQDRVKAILKAAGIESDDAKPEEQVKALTQTTNELAFRNAVLESAVQNGIPSEGVKYFQFLIQDATSQLAEGDELSEEKLAEIVAEAKKRGGGKAATTTVGGGNGKPAPRPGESGQLTLDQFCRMSITEKSELFNKSPDIYKALYAEAKAKKRLI